MAILKSDTTIGGINILEKLKTFLPLSGGTLTGNLTLKGSGNYGTKINFGDGDYVHLYESTDDCLEIKAKQVNFVTSDATDTGFKRNGNPFRGSLIYMGTAITGTSTTATVFSGSGVACALVNDVYINTSTWNVYQCTVAGATSAAKWVYKGNMQGAAGSGSNLDLRGCKIGTFNGKNRFRTYKSVTITQTLSAGAGTGASVMLYMKMSMSNGSGTTEIDNKIDLSTAIICGSVSTGTECHQMPCTLNGVKYDFYINERNIQYNVSNTTNASKSVNVTLSFLVEHCLQ